MYNFPSLSLKFAYIKLNITTKNSMHKCLAQIDFAFDAQVEHFFVIHIDESFNGHK